MSQVKQIKEATDIVQVIGEKLQLQRSGTNWRTLCPFHSESSPSFFVSEQFQRYKCFGCGKSGDAFTFLEEYDGMTFGEALTFLAERAGIKLESYRPTQEDEERQRLLELLNLAKEYYHFLLTKHEAGKEAREYLKDRGVTADSIKLFQLGFALPSWDGLIKYLHQKKKYSLDELQKAGMIIAGKNNRSYDRFRHRLMFPLTNHRGQVVGFSGRVLDPTAKEAKYINSPETLLYHKSHMLFGFSELYQEIRKKNEVVVVEGEFDVISSAQAHVNNVVAIKGSALTQQHLQLIGRVAEKVLFSLDMDSAGVAATKRAIELAQQLPLEMRVVTLGVGKDPDELARTQPVQWREAVKNSISVYEFLLQASLQQYDPSEPEGKRKIIDELAPVFGGITHAVEQDVYLKKLATALGVKEELVRQDVERFKFKNQPGNKTPLQSIKAKDQTPAVKLSRRQKLEMYLLYLLFTTSPNEIIARAQEVQDVSWQTPGVSVLLEKLSQQPADFDLQKFIKQLPEDLRQLYFERSTDPEFEYVARVDREKEWKTVLTDLQRASVTEKIRNINRQLEELDSHESLTEEQERRQQELLAQIVTIRQIAAFKK